MHGESSREYGERGEGLRGLPPWGAEAWPADEATREEPARARRALVLGAGIAGLAAALRLERSGWDVGLRERAKGRDAGGHGFILLDNALAALDGLGLGGAAAARGAELARFELATHTGAVMLETRLGAARGYRRTELVALLEGALRPGAVRFGCRFVDVGDGDGGRGRRVARFDDGAGEAADLFVASDGVRSAARRLVFPDARLTEVRVKEMVSHARDPGLARGLGDRFLKLVRDDGGIALGMVPTGDDTITWYVQLDARRFALDERTAEGRRRFVAATFAGWAEPVPSLIARTDFGASHIWHTTDLDPLPRLHDRDLVLTGDAAHAFLPFTSQGVGAALDDALALGDALDALPVADALARYSERRLPAVAEIVAGGRRLRDRFLAGPAACGGLEVPVVGGTTPGATSRSTSAAAEPA